MKQRLIRPTAALFPIVGIIGAACWDAEKILQLYACYYLVFLCTLCAAEYFRNAAAREPGVRRVDQKFSGALLLLLIGAIITGVLILTPGYSKQKVPEQGSFFIIAWLLHVEHLFEERMYAFGRRLDGIILSCIANGALLFGFLMEEKAMAVSSVPLLSIIIAAGAGTLISIVTSYVIEPMHGFSLKSIERRYIRDALIQTGLYISGCVVAYKYLRPHNEALSFPFLFGLIPWRLARTICRRTADESRPLNLFLTAYAAIPAAIAAWLPAAAPFAITAAIALLCGAIVFCTPSKRLCIGIALIAASLIPIPMPLISTALAAAAIIINMKQAFLKKV